MKNRTLSLPKDVGNLKEYYQEHKHKLEGIHAPIIRGLINDTKGAEQYEMCAFFTLVLDSLGESIEGDAVQVLTIGDTVLYDGWLYTYEGQDCPNGCCVKISDDDEVITVSSKQITKI